MPIYEYEGGGCGHRLEVLQRISDAPLEHCPACEQDALRKLVSAAGFQLKGTGWYVTHFRDKGKQAAKKSEDGGEKATKTEDKPAATSDSASSTASTSTTTE